MAIVKISELVLRPSQVTKQLPATLTSKQMQLKDGAEKENFKGELKVVSSFKEAMTILTEIADKDTVVLFENDLPDNYSK